MTIELDKSTQLIFAGIDKYTRAPKSKLPEAKQHFIQIVKKYNEFRDVPKYVQSIEGVTSFDGLFTYLKNSTLKYFEYKFKQVRSNFNKKIYKK